MLERSTYLMEIRLSKKTSMRRTESLQPPPPPTLRGTLLGSLLFQFFKTCNFYIHILRTCSLVCRRSTVCFQDFLHDNSKATAHLPYTTGWFLSLPGNSWSWGHVRQHSDTRTDPAGESDRPSKQIDRHIHSEIPCLVVLNVVSLRDIESGWGRCGTTGAFCCISRCHLLALFFRV